jgi:hypothetical protein
VGLAAWAERIDVRTGRRAEVLVLAGRPGADLPAALDAHAGLVLRWVRRRGGGFAGSEGTGTPSAAHDAFTACEDPECAWTEARAEAFEDALVRLHVGRWPIEASREGARLRCAALAEREVEAIDVQVAVGPSADSVLEERVVRAAPSGLLLELQRVCVDDEAARRERRRVEDEVGVLRDGGWRLRLVSRTGAIVTARLTLDWEEVDLLDGDRRRLASAMAYDAALRRPLGPDEFDLRDPDALAAQVLLHDRAVASASTPEARRVAAQAFARLLGAAVEAGAAPVHGERLVRLYLDVLDDPALAARIARAHSGRDDVPVARFRALEREALARHDLDALEAALVRDGLATRQDAAAVATALATTIDAGVPAPLAEGALLAARSLVALIDPRRATFRRPTSVSRARTTSPGSDRAGVMVVGTREADASETLASPVAFPLAGLPGALDALAALSVPDPWNARATYLLIFPEAVGGASLRAQTRAGETTRPPRAAVAAVPDAGQVAVVRVVGPGGAPSALIAGRTDDGVVRRLTAGRLLADAVPPGRASCLYVTTDLPDPSPALEGGAAGGAAVRRSDSGLVPRQVFALAGEVRDGVLLVDRVGPNVANVEWDGLARAVAEPLAALEVRFFPPPEARVVLRSPDEAARAAHNVVAADVRADGAILRLRAATMSELGAALVELAAPIVGRAQPPSPAAAAGARLRGLSSLPRASSRSTRR